MLHEIKEFLRFLLVDKLQGVFYFFDKLGDSPEESDSETERRAGPLRVSGG
jgi:hypothetical protein